MWWNFLVIKFQMKVLGVTIFDIILFFYLSCVACICINTWWKLKRFFIFCCSFFFYGCGFICLEFGSEELLIWDAHIQNFAINVEFQVLLKFLLGSGIHSDTYRNFRDEKSILHNNIPFHSLTKVCKIPLFLYHFLSVDPSKFSLRDPEI
jgi:hypothetical protein